MKELNLSIITGETFSVRASEDGRLIAFKGALRLTGMEDYAPILALLRASLKDATGEVVLDVRELDFLNSSGITMFSRFVIEARDRANVRVDFIASDAIPWQGRSLKNLQRLMPSLNVVLK
jgi:hypothetical protein